MKKRASPPEFPRPRTLIHPGRFNPIRIQSLRSPAADMSDWRCLPG